MQLFRPEVQAGQTDRLHGSIGLAPPVSWQLIGFGCLAMVILAIIFLQQATYARVEVVKGDIDTDPGSAIVVPSRAGIITDVLVADRSSVHKGQPIAVDRRRSAPPFGT